MKKLWGDVVTDSTTKDGLARRIEQARRFRQRQKIYVLGEANPNAYFTQREVGIMKLLLKGHTIHLVADILGLSQRTVEYYVKNMRMKLGCSTKSKLIELVLKSNFFKEPPP